MSGRLQDDNLGLVAAGVAFYGVLALVPALAGAVAIYGLVADPADVVRTARTLRGALPGDVVDLVVDQLARITAGPTNLLSTGAVVGFLVSLWSANRGTRALITGLNIAYRERERRGVVVLNAVSLAMTLVLLIASVTAVGVVAVLPTVVPAFVLAGALPALLRWAGLGVGMLLLMAVLARWGPSRATPRWRWISVGSVLATAAWLLGSAGFSWYVERFGHYNETFGALGGVAITLTWGWLTAYLLLLGAEVNAELEHETLADSTVGPDRPLGERGAFVADDVPPSTG